MIARLSRFLKENHASFQEIPHYQTYTAQETAQAEHVSGKNFAKVVMIKVDGQNLMAVVPADQMVDEEKVKRCIKASEVRIESEAEFRNLFPDCETGAMPPFGNLFGLPVYLDDDLANQPEIVFNGGNHHSGVKMNYTEYQKLAKPFVCDISRSNAA